MKRLRQATLLAGVHKTCIRGIQDTRQIVDGKTNNIENNDKQAEAVLGSTSQLRLGLSVDG